jgi:predicted TPR repeat methyltransferase
VSANPFDERAASWDDDPAKVERAADVARRIAAAVPLDGTTRLLEYGAGTGLVTQALRAEVGPVTLADSSRGMREVIESKIAAGALPDARVWALDLSTEAPPSERFDVIVTVLALHHIPHLEPVLAGFAALLDPGGHLCIVDLERKDGSFHGVDFDGHHGFERPALAAALADAGFGDVTFAGSGDLVREGTAFPLFLAVAARPHP